MARAIERVLVIGASGFVGKRLARALLAENLKVRCLARTPAKVADLAAAGCEIDQGDMLDAASVMAATEGADAIYVAVHTLSPQPRSGAEAGFMEVETAGLRNIAAACLAQGARRLIYLTSLGTDANASSVWLRERGKAEQFLFDSGLDVTVLRPGQIVGVGGTGFDMMARQAKSRVAVMMGVGDQRWRNIAVDDLVYYLVGVLNDPRTFGQRYDVGCDDILTNDQMVDVAADVLGRAHPAKLHVPRRLTAALAPAIERVAKLPRGAFRGLIESMDDDAIGDPHRSARCCPALPSPTGRRSNAPWPNDRSRKPRGASSPTMAGAGRQPGRASSRSGNREPLRWRQEPLQRGAAGS